MSEDATKGWKVYHRRGRRVILSLPLWIFADKIMKTEEIKPIVSVERFKGGSVLIEEYTVMVKVIRKIWTPDPERRVSASIEVYLDVYDLNQSQSQGGSSSSRGDAV